MRTACTVGLFAVVLFYASGLQAAILFKGAATRTFVQPLHLKVSREDTPWLLAAPGMGALTSVSNDLRRRMAEQFVALRFSEHREAARLKLEEWKAYESLEAGVFPPDAVTATGALGIQSCYLRDLRVVDGHGLTDATVARNPVTSPNSERLMAHDRRPPVGYVLEERGVNIMVLPSAASEKEGLSRAAYAYRLGPGLWMPFDAADHDWVLGHFDQARLGMRTDRESRWRLQAAAIRRYEDGSSAAPP